MIKFNKIWLFLVTFLVFGAVTASAAEFVYPLPVISKPSCRFDKFSSLGNDCKENLPILKTDDYSKLKNDYDLRRIYTVLWTGTYTYGWDAGNGSHLGVDIATSEGTPVVSMADGTVTFAGFKTGRGNVVTVKHYVNGRTIYSNYGHMSKITVENGDSVDAGDKIGEVGSTGNSTGNHLHFQIDINNGSTSHPYYYYQNCPGDEWTVVNAGQCKNDLLANTIDPLLFLETQGAIIKGGVVDQEKTKPQKISQKDLTSVKEIQEMEIKDFLRIYKVKIKFDSTTGNIPLGGTMTAHVSVTKKSNGKAFNGNFPGDFMYFIANRDLVKIFPDKLRSISDGKRDIVFTGLKIGTTTLYIRIGTVQIDTQRLNIYNPKVKQSVESVKLSANSSLYLGEEKKAFAIFSDKNKSPLVELPYSGEYVVEAKNAYLCQFNANASNVNTEFNRTCGLGNYKDTLTLSYNNTFKGVPIFGILALDNSKTAEIKIYNKSTKEVLAKKTITIKNPRDITIWYEYKEAVLSLLGKGVIDLTGKGYFSENRQLDEETAVRWITNFLVDKMNNSSNSTDKNKYLDSIKEISKLSPSKYTKLTRLDMLELISKYIPKDYKKNAISYRDLTTEQSVMANKIFSTTYTWLDDFGDKYFQPDQALTRGEAAYMLYQAQF